MLQNSKIKHNKVIYTDKYSRLTTNYNNIISIKWRLRWLDNVPRCRSDFNWHESVSSKGNINDQPKVTHVFIKNECKNMTESQLKRYANIHIEQLTDALDQNRIQDDMTSKLEL